MAGGLGRSDPIRGKLILALAALAVSLLALEGGFRLLGIRGQYPEPRIDEVFPAPGRPRNRLPFGFVPFATIRSTYASDPRGYFDPGARLDHVHNSEGWRDGEHTIAKPPGTYRILGLGDSYLWGQGVRRADIVLSVLQGILSEEVPGLIFETINTGMSATNTEFQAALLEERGLRYDPDLVIVHFVLNDIEQDLWREGPKVEFFTDYTSIYLSPDWLSQHSQLWSWARQRVLATVQGRRYVRSSVESFRENSFE